VPLTAKGQIAASVFSLETRLKRFIKRSPLAMRAVNTLRHHLG
jgi:hypothetical protein